MSAVNDATRLARDAVSKAGALVRDLETQLAAVPGWLRVGDPVRHADPADRLAANEAAEILSHLERARWAKLMLAERVEQALGTPPDNIFAYVAYSQWLESLPPDGADALLERIVTSPERLLAGVAKMSPEKAQAILDYIAGNSGRVGGGDAFVAGVPLDEADRADLLATGWSIRRGEQPAVDWNVLLPVRLETRFLPPGKQGPNANSNTSIWRLLVRVEPDAPVMASRPGAIGRDEAGLVAQCWAEAGGTLDGEGGNAAFAKLAHRVGPARASYLLRSVPVSRRDEGFEVFDDYAERPPAIAEPMIGLPSTIEIWGGPEGAPALLATLNPDREAMAKEATIDAVARPDADGRTPRRWWNSFTAARDVGLACEIALTEDPPGFPVLFCIGYDDPGAAAIDPAALFQFHSDGGRLGTLEPLTPTNTIAGAPTCDLGADPAPWLDAARRAPSSGAGLAMALAGRTDLSGFPEPNPVRSEAANAIATALWPVLWQRTLKDTADGSEEVWRLGEWSARNVHAFGPYPVLRFGDLPYGVLPISDYDRWIWRKPIDKMRASDPRPEFLALAALPLLSEPLLQQALKLGTAAGADTERLLQILEHVPTSRAYGSRQMPATVLFDALSAALGGSNPGDRVRDWEAQFAYLRSKWPPGPKRRYSPVLAVEPLPRKVHPDHRHVLRLFLDATWSMLAEYNDVSERWRPDGNAPPSVLARLVRHSLLTTQAEVVRLGLPDPQPPSFVLPLNEVEQFMQLASGGERAGIRVYDLPEWATNLVAIFNNDPRAAVVCRQFEDVREAVLKLGEIEPEVTDVVLPAVLDLTSHRVDAWWTGLSQRRLASLAAQGGRPRLGCYGWVDDLTPNPDPTPPTNAGLIHAPGYTQALTAAVLRDQAVHHRDAGQWDITLDSAKVRTAAALAEQVRAGVHISEALGREIERRVGEPGLVLALRKQFPARPEWIGRRVCDGQQVLDAAVLPAGIDREAFDDLRVALDAYADLLVTDALHDVVEGRATAAAEALEAAAGLGAPPEFRLLRTQRGGSTVKTSVVVALPWLSDWDDPALAVGQSPVAVADPALAGLLSRELPGPDDWTWLAGGASVSLSDLGLGVSDVAMFDAAQLSYLASLVLNEKPSTGSGADHHARCRNICMALGGGSPRSDSAAVLMARLARLRDLAEEVVDALRLPGADIAPARPWGITESDPAKAADLLDARLAAAGDVAADAEADATTLAERIRILLPSALPLPLACPRPAQTPTFPLADGDWLETVASVRPAVARLELAQLTAANPWPIVLDGPASVWAHGDLEADAHREIVVAFAPPRPDEADESRDAIVEIDSWAETVPARAHTTWAAFGYDAPRARPQQAILLVVPPDVDAPDVPSDLRGSVLEARRQARMRLALPPSAHDVQLALPMSMLITDVTPAGVTLAREE